MPSTAWMPREPPSEGSRYAWHLRAVDAGRFANTPGLEPQSPHAASPAGLLPSAPMHDYERFSAPVHTPWRVRARQYLSLIHI